MQELFSRAIDVYGIEVVCRNCGKHSDVRCCSFNMGEDILVKKGECTCTPPFYIEDILVSLDERTILETLSLFGYYVPRSMS